MGVLDRAETLLTDTSQAVKHGAVRVLAEAGRLEPLRARLEVEQDDLVRDAMLEVLLPDGPITVTEARRRVASAAKRGKLGRSVKKWIDASTLPQLVWDGMALTDQEVR